MNPLLRRSRTWCFTANLNEEIDNPILEEPPVINNLVYACWQYEKEAHLHIQGFLQVKNAMQGKSVHDHLFEWCGVKAHLEVARAEAGVNKVYCGKEETRVAGPFEFGKCPKQGQRSDLAKAFHQFMDEGLSDDLVNTYTSQLVMYGNKFKQLKEELLYKEWSFKARTGPPKVIVLYGESGSGKTRTAVEAGVAIGQRTIMCAYGRYPWGSYRGEKIVCFDEFNGTQVPIDQMLRYLDRYDVEVHVPYLGNKPFIPETIYICSNLKPDDWYEGQKGVTLEQVVALKRRFTEVIEYKWILASESFEKFWHKGGL